LFQPVNNFYGHQLFHSKAMFVSNICKVGTLTKEINDWPYQRLSKDKVMSVD